MNQPNQVRISERVDQLGARIAGLKAAIAAAERKRKGVEDAIKSRRLALQRLYTQLALFESGAARSNHG